MCQTPLEEVQKNLEAFNSIAADLPAERQKGLLYQAQELRESLEVFAALALQSKAYFESLAADMARGQVTYDRNYTKAFDSAKVEVNLMDL